MTLDQVLLTRLVVAAVAGVVITLLNRRTQARWRQRNLLREFIRRWAGATLTEAKVVIGQWRKEYNQGPHSSLGYQPPAPEAIISVTQT